MKEIEFIEILKEGNPDSVQSVISDVVMYIEEDTGKSEQLKKQLLLSYEESSLRNLQSSIVWALGKYRDASLKPFFVQSLRVGVGTGEPNVLWQSIVALSDIGEEIGGGGLLEFELNREKALDYLQNIMV